MGSLKVQNCAIKRNISDIKLKTFWQKLESIMQCYKRLLLSFLPEWSYLV